MPSGWTGPGLAVRWGGTAILSAVAARQVEVARWLWGNVPHQTNQDDVHGIVERAVMNGDFETAELLLPQERKVAEYVGHLMRFEAIEPMLERGYLKENKTAAVGAIWISAREGDLELMKRIAALHPKPPRGKNSDWLRFWGYAMNAACEGEDVVMMKWVMEHPTGRLLCKQMKDDSIMDTFNELLQQAATGGHIEAMEFLVERGCTDQYAYAMVNAARKGHLNCIEWLLQHTYQPDPHSSADRIVLEAAKLGYLDILKFLHAPRYATEDMSPKRRKIEDAGVWWRRSRDAMDEAAANGHLEVVKWLYANRSEGYTTTAMDGAACNGHLEVVQWLGRITTEGCTTKAMDSAASHGHLKVLQWLHANRSEGCMLKALDTAIGSGNLRVASWLQLHFPQHVPKHDRLWLYPNNLFDTLLFIQVNYPDIFTLEFGWGTKSDLDGEYDKGSDILIQKWLEERYPGRPTKNREVHLWSMM